MYIGEAAKQSGATPKAIRHYEALGLLKPVQRQGSYRCYGEAELATIRLIKQAQALGFRLLDIRELLGPDPARLDWPSLLTHIAERRAAIAAEIARLTELDQALQAAAAEIAACPDLGAPYPCDTSPADRA